MSAFFGFGEDWLLEEQYAYWPQLLALAAKWKFNTVRLAFSFPNSNATHHNPIDVAKMNELLNLLKSRGFEAVLDCHNYLDMDNFFGSQAWFDDWKAMATRYKGDSRVAAFQLFNEPPAEVHLPEFDDKLNILKAYAQCTDNIRAIDPDRTVVWAGEPFTRVTDIAAFKRPNVIVDLHLWRRYITIQEADLGIQQLIDVIKLYQGFGFTVWNGELGIYQEVPLDVSKYWCVNVINAGLNNKMGVSWWLYSRNFGTTWERGLADSVFASSNYNFSPRALEIAAIGLGVVDALLCGLYITTHIRLNASRGWWEILWL